MTYVPKPDVEGINSSQTNPLKDLAILLVGFIIVLGVFMFALASAGEFLLSRVSLEREMMFFSTFDWTKKEKKREENIRQLEEMAAKLSPSSELNFRVTIMCEELPNAFALPGGIISVTSGLLSKVKTERGLAFVIGHEIGHITKRHHIRGLGYQLGLALASAFIGVEVSDSISGGLLGDVIARSNSREAEREADSFALNAMAKAYGDSAGAEEFFEVVMKDENKLLKLIPSWMSTHPATDERVQSLKKLKAEKAKLHGIKSDCKS